MNDVFIMAVPNSVDKLPENEFRLDIIWAYLRFVKFSCGFGFDILIQRSDAEVFHDDVDLNAGFAGADHSDDIWMAQFGQNFDLPSDVLFFLMIV